MGVDLYLSIHCFSTQENNCSGRARNCKYHSFNVEHSSYNLTNVSFKCSVKVDRATGVMESQNPISDLLTTETSFVVLDKIFRIIYSLIVDEIRAKTLFFSKHDVVGWFYNLLLASFRSGYFRFSFTGSRWWFYFVVIFVLFFSCSIISSS